MDKYYIVKKNNNSEKYLYYDLSVDWNVEKIIPSSEKNGFIVQKVMFMNNTNVVLNNEKKDYMIYYEAWTVNNRKVIDGGNNSDDMFSCGSEYSIEDCIKKSIGVKGKIEYSAQVYWINEKDVLYDFVCSWKYGFISMANGLKSIDASYCLNFENLKPLFVRDKFIHAVDFTDKFLIEEVIRKKFKVRYESNDKRFNDVLDYIFGDSDLYADLKQKLYIK